MERSIHLELQLNMFLSAHIPIKFLWHFLPHLRGTQTVSHSANGTEKTETRKERKYHPDASWGDMINAYTFDGKEN